MISSLSRIFKQAKWRKYVAMVFGLALLFISADISLSQEPAGAPETQYWVTDQAEIISTSVEQRLTDNAMKHEEQTSNQVVVVTLNSLDGWSIERYGRWLGNKWGIGQQDVNNGVLLLVAPNERKVRIEVGTGLEKVITNAIAKSIIDTRIIPQFKKERMEKGVIDGHNAIIEALGGEYEDESWIDKLLYFVIAPFFIIGRAFGFGGGRFSGGGGSFGGGGASGGW